jgi:predicted ATPase
MRVGISGPGGAGKTTLLSRMHSELGIPFVEEGVWEWLADQQLGKPWDLTAEDQLRLQRHVISFKIETERALPSFISDRTTVDAVSLLTLRMQTRGHPVPASLCARALCHARATYDAVLLLGPGYFSAAQSDDRSLGHGAIQQVEYDLTRSIYESLRIPVIFMPFLPAPEIMPFVVTALRKQQYRVGTA